MSSQENFAVKTCSDPSDGMGARAEEDIYLGGECCEPDVSFEWSTMNVEDAESLYIAQNQLVLEHQELTKPFCSATFDDWKTVLGYPLDNARRMEFNRNMPSASTRHGDRLHCLKVNCCRDGKRDIAGFIDFEVKQSSDALCGTVREVYIRSLIVPPHMRRRGYGTALYNAMLEYLGPGDLDAITLCVTDLNRGAMVLYFQLGFKVTQWFAHQLGDKAGFQVVFLRMQKLQGDRLLSKKPGAICLSLQDMPRLFQDKVVGEIVTVVWDERVQRARIEEYDPKSRRFTLKLFSQYLEEPECTPECCHRLVWDVCVNQLYACGFLTFERAPSVCLNEGLLQIQVSSSVHAFPKAKISKRAPGRPTKCLHLERLTFEKVEKEASEPSMSIESNPGNLRVSSLIQSIPGDPIAKKNVGRAGRPRKHPKGAPKKKKSGRRRKLGRPRTNYSKLFSKFKLVRLTRKTPAKSLPLIKKSIGRPKGSQDKQPRKAGSGGYRHGRSTSS
jgi:ribosomal protein S18 acetylase RimI-like enzyme